MCREGIARFRNCHDARLIIPIMWRVFRQLLHRSIVASFSGGPSPATNRENHEGRGEERGLCAHFPASSCERVRALPFPSWGRLKAKTFLSNPRGKEKVRFYARGSLTAAVNGKRRES